MATISDEFLQLLVCPRDHAALRQDNAMLVCTGCGARFDGGNGIPDMILDHGKPTPAATAPATGSAAAANEKPGESA